MSPIKTTALAVLIVALGLIASIRLGNASALAGPDRPDPAPHVLATTP